MSTVQYINTDLDLLCPRDITPLVAWLEARRWVAMTVHRRGRYWFAGLEVNLMGRNPAATLKAMLKDLEQLPPDLQALWQRCTRREFHLGYESGLEPHCIEHPIGHDLLQRIVALGGSLRMTMYALPKESADQAPGGHLAPKETR